MPVTWRYGSLKTILLGALLISAASARAQPLGTVAAPDTLTVQALDSRPAASIPKISGMLAGRLSAAGVRLADGRVLVCGGYIPGGSALESAEIYDPRKGKWSAAGSLREARYGHGLVLLNDGRALAAGGRNNTHGDSLSSVEIFDPKTGAWSEASSMRRARDSFALAVLPDGRVLAAGGYQAVSGRGTQIAAAEIFSPLSDAWSEVEPLDEPRVSPAFTTLPDGRIFLAGGSDEARGLDETAVFEPSRGGWTVLTPLADGNETPKAVALADGKVLVAGGYDRGRFLRSGELHDLRTGDRAATESIGETRFAHALVRAGRFVGIIGGEIPDRALNSTSVFEPATRSWRSGPRLLYARGSAVVIPLDGSRVLVAGGGRGNTVALNNSEIVDLASGGNDRGASSDPIASQAPAAMSSPGPESGSGPALTLAPAPPPRRFAARGPERPNDYAIVVGVDRYKSLPGADFAEGDAREMAAAFGALGVPEENIVLLSGTRATLSEVSKYVEEWLPRRVSKDSRVFFYYSGHGAPDVKDGTAFLMPWDADAAFVKSTGFSLSRLYQSLGRLPAASVIAVIDACFSGAGGRSVIAPGLRPLVPVRMPPAAPPRVSVLAAAESEEIAGTLPERGHGLFSYYVLEGLSGAADVNGTGHLTLKDLHAYVRKHVILDARLQNREQNPTLTTPNSALALY